MNDRGVIYDEECSGNFLLKILYKLFTQKFVGTKFYKRLSPDYIVTRANDLLRSVNVSPCVSINGDE